MSDEQHMRTALNMARQGLGLVSNARPSVGCAIVKDDIVVGLGRTGNGGAPHAEVAALQMAGAQAKGATAYVTLEPCAHHGNTPPCTGALIGAGIKRCVIANPDPFKEVNGAGVRQLKAAGVEVQVGLHSEEAHEIHKGFFLSITQNRPLVTLKISTSADGKIAAAEGERTKITGDLAHRHTHLERSRHDAILVGSGTMQIDQPQLTTRLPGLEHHSMRFALTKNLEILGQNESIDVDPHDLKAVLDALTEKGVTRLLVEGGAAILTSFLESGFYDRFLWYKAPHTIGPQGKSALNGLEIADMPTQFNLKLQEKRALGEDLLEIYSPSA